MSQTLTSTDIILDRQYGGESTAITVPGSGLTTIASIPTFGLRLLCFHYDVATQTLDDFAVYARAHVSGQLVDFTPNAPSSDWTSLPSGGRFKRVARSTTATGALVDANLKVVTAAQNGYFEMEVDGLAEIIIKASSSADSAAVTGRWSVT